MIRSVKVTNYLGDELNLVLNNPEESSDFAVIGMDGLGPVQADINTTELATQDGALYNSARLQSRNIVLTLLFEGNDIEEQRHQTYKYFPVKKKVKLDIITDKRAVTISGYVESNEATPFSSREGAQISIVCPTPYFYSMDISAEETFSTLEPNFSFEYEGGDPVPENWVGYWSNEGLDADTEFGIVHPVRDLAIFYDGDEETGVYITIHAVGEVSGELAITSRTAQERFVIDLDKVSDYTGSSLVAGDTIEICTVKGSKSITLIRSSVSTNILNCIGRDSDWFQITKGYNTFAYNADSGVTNMQLSLAYNVIYEGV